MKKVLILGKTGMLGSMVYDWFKTAGDTVVLGTSRREGDGEFFDAEATDSIERLKAIVEKFKPDFIVNCIGIIKPYCKDNDPAGVLRAINVNARFPHLMAKAVAPVKVIQIATDCVYSGQKGKYIESDLHDALDVYGKTKSLGEVEAENLLNIRCSIIGPEVGRSTSLLEWFLSNPPKSHLKGFSHHDWNGVTTLQYGQYCHKIIMEDLFDELRAKRHCIHYIVNETVNKFELLNIFKDVYGKDYEIEEVNNIGPRVDRTVESEVMDVERRSMRQTLQDLRDYCEKSELYS